MKTMLFSSLKTNSFAHLMNLWTRHRIFYQNALKRENFGSKSVKERIGIICGIIRINRLNGIALELLNERTEGF